ncbi:PEP/pyruvate-binding domain-containing protein [Brachybacterium sacelli]|uniref:Pyruvate,water dikinase n=1 Tax=Brachybacterium sacelli TaxID=173364 RepID=A0ABS4WVP5_9MICO|nr:PEP/pyruvate-binding domain-containing protein [Brachybacterium sacelli]MBP2380265.1 pyruvate,water dikinase [Brachybacterium sacelli]
MLVRLRDATRSTCGAKAATLGTLLRAGLPVPDGLVVPFAMHRGAGEEPLGGSPEGIAPRTADLPTVARTATLHSTAEPPTMDLRVALDEALGALADVPVAVRSSATGEDSADSSAAGQYETVLAVRGADGIAAAVHRCWASLAPTRALDPSAGAGPDGDLGSSAMAVIIQPLVDAEVAGVLFTPTQPGGATRLEASWGLGAAVVGGEVSPDAYEVTANGLVTSEVADKHRRVDREGNGVVAREVAAEQRRAPCLDEDAAVELARLGHRISELLGGPQDIEWARSGGDLRILQSRPITAEPPSVGRDAPAVPPNLLRGTPGSRGQVAGPVRIARGPEDFSRVRAGDVLVCPWTDPAWTPLLRVVDGIITEVGGALSHAAIVAREQHVPAVLGVAGATSSLRDGEWVELDGSAGTIARTAGGTPR